MAQPVAFLIAVALLAGTVSQGRADDTRDSIAVPVGTQVLRLHAVGAQIYECKPDPAGTLAWQFREPIAALLQEGKTVGRHFAGPSWQLMDGSLIVGKVAAKAMGASPNDIPWLRLTVSDRQGEGTLTPVTTIQRLNTLGGNKSGPCRESGAMVAEPYAADYVFSRP